MRKNSPDRLALARAGRAVSFSEAGPWRGLRPHGPNGKALSTPSPASSMAGSDAEVKREEKKRGQVHLSGLRHSAAPLTPGHSPGGRGE